MKRNAFKLSALFLVILSMYACKKDANGSTTGSNTKTLTTGIWTLQKIQYEQSDGSWQDDPDPQDLDHVTITFNKDNSTSVNQDGNAIAGTWEASSDFSQLTVTHSGDVTGALLVHVLTSSSLQLDNGTFMERMFFIHE
jgi:hypothetical protein